MSDLPRVYPVAAETWTGPDEDERPVRQRVVSAVGYALAFLVVVALAILVPEALPWVIAVSGACATIHLVVVIARAPRRRRAVRGDGPSRLS